MKKKFMPVLALTGLLTLGTVSFVSLSSCGSTKVEKLEISASSTTVETNKTITLTAKADGKDVTSETLFTSSDTSKLVITGTTAMGVSVGSATISATYNGVTSNNIEITITGEVIQTTSFNEIYEDAATAASENGNVTAESYTAKGVVVTATNNDAVYYDGESLAISYGAKNPTPGKTFIIDGNMSNYWGAIQFKNPVLTEVTDPTQQISLPSATTWSASNWEAFKTLGSSNSNKITDPTKSTRAQYVKTEGMILEELTSGGEVVFSKEGVTNPIKLSKSSQDFKDRLKDVNIGSELTVTCAVIGYNSSSGGYYNAMGTDFEVNTEAILPETISVSVDKDTIKAYEYATLTSTFTPAGAASSVTYTLADEDKEEAFIKGDKLYGLKDGEVTVTGRTTNGKTGTVQVVISGTSENTFGTAEIKTVADLVSMNTESVKALGQKVAYKVTGKVIEAKNDDKYGNIVIQNPEGSETIKSYGTAMNFASFTIEDDGFLEFKNDKNFNTEILGKLFDVNDTVEFFVVPYIFSGTNSESGEKYETKNFYFAFNKVVEKGPVETYETVDVKDLQLNTENLFPGISGTSYKDYDGLHKVGEVTFETSNILSNSYQTLEGKYLQWKTNEGKLATKNEIKLQKICIVVYNSYDWSNDIEVFIGDSKMTSSLISNTDSGFKTKPDKSGNTFPIKKMIIQYTLTEETTGILSMQKATGEKRADYLESITLDPSAN